MSLQSPAPVELPSTCLGQGRPLGVRTMVSFSAGRHEQDYHIGTGATAAADLIKTSRNMS